jgi:phage minor structural protein
MIQIYADGALAYDSRLEDYDLQGLKVTSGLNKGGTAEIILPPSHPAYNRYTGYKTIVEIYRDDRLKFRGRALYPVDDYHNLRTVICEGELCFFQDAVSRPYLYQNTPEAVFTEVVNVYNSQVEPAKQFKLGTVTVADPNDYIRLESENAESALDTLNKLLERCGGYVVFTTDPHDGKRVINWYAALSYRSSQVIEFGENLLDFSRSGANTNLATAVLPYGAKDSVTGKRLTIESVNDGRDYIQDDEAVGLYGFIIKPVSWDDVTEPANLLQKAQEWLEANRYIVTSLSLSALDLSYVDKNIDDYQVGDTIRVKSLPHRVDEDFLLTERSEDLLNPASSQVTLGKELRTLTGADVAGDAQSRAGIEKVTTQITASYQINVANVVAETERSLISLIEQTSENIVQTVAQTYTTNDQVTAAISASMTQLADQFLFEFESLRATVDENDVEAREQLTEIYKYISFDNGDIKLGGSDSAITLTLENDMIVFKKNGVQFGWWDGVDFHTGNIVVEVNERAQFGNFAFVPRSNGSLSFLKIGG